MPRPRLMLVCGLVATMLTTDGGTATGQTGAPPPTEAVVCDAVTRLVADLQSVASDLRATAETLRSEVKGLRKLRRSFAGQAPAEQIEIASTQLKAAEGVRTFV